MRIFKRKLLLPIAFSLFSCGPGNRLAGQTPLQQKAKNIIFFIGDGMGLASITGARIWLQGSSGQLAMEKFPITGFAKTYSSSGFVTDSAAAATALAAGVKTYNGAIGYTDAKRDRLKKSQKVQTLVDLALKMGKSVGIVTTARVTHATPAAFYSHAKHRSEESLIASQVGSSGITLLLGGGRQFFRSSAAKHNPGNRQDGRDVIAELKAQNWQYAANLPQLLALSQASFPTKILGLFDESHVPYDLEKKAEDPSLLNMTSFALNYLGQNPNGYFLMVEGGRIDHAAHENDAKNVFGELVAFDRTLGYALDHTSEKETLIVVTADHETGGLALSGGKSSPLVQGMSFLGENSLQKTGIRSIVTWATGPNGSKGDNPSLFPMNSAMHTAVDVPILARGPGSSQFSGFMENTLIAKKIAQAMGDSYYLVSSR